MTFMHFCSEIAIFIYVWANAYTELEEETGFKGDFDKTSIFLEYLKVFAVSQVVGFIFMNPIKAFLMTMCASSEIRASEADAPTDLKVVTSQPVEYQSSFEL